MINAIQKAISQEEISALVDAGREIKIIELMAALRDAVEWGAETIKFDASYNNISVEVE